MLERKSELKLKQLATEDDQQSIYLLSVDDQ